MQPRTRACLDDIIRASELIQSALVGMSFDEYLSNWVKQSAVERQFMIVGEALIRIRNAEPIILGSIPESNAVIGFRNLLAHGYDSANPKAIFKFAGEPPSHLLEIVRDLIK